jgi:hypothetical protein
VVEQLQGKTLDCGTFALNMSDAANLSYADNPTVGPERTMAQWQNMGMLLVEGGSYSCEVRNP